MWPFAFLVLLSACAAAAPVGKLASLTEFEQFRSEHAGFAVLVYAPWCGHSKALMPMFEAAAAQPGVPPFMMTDGTEAEALATKLDVKGYPTVLFIRRGDGPPIEYDGEREASAIAAWAKLKLQPLDERARALATPSAVLSFVKGAPMGLILFASDAASAEAEVLLAVAASAPDIRCGISTADPSSPELGLRAGVARPALVAFTSHEEGAVVMDPQRPITHASLLRFARAHQLPAVVTYASGKLEEQLFSSDVSVHLLYFYEGAIAAAVSSSLSAAAASLRGDAILATVDVRAHADVASYFDVGASGSIATPALMGFSLENGTKVAHAGEMTSEAIVGFARAAAAGSIAPHLRSQPAAAAQSGPVMELVGSTFAKVAHDRTKDVLVQLYAPGCAHCSKLRPAYEAVATKLAEHEDIVVAQMDAVANDVLGLEPEGFPTIVLYTKANKEGVEYDGSRDAHDLLQFVHDARSGRNHIGGLSESEAPLDANGPDEDDGYRVEL